MKIKYSAGAILLIISLFGTAILAANSDRIYGKITTSDGDTFTGYIRWDKNEASWIDMLNGSKAIDKSRDERNSSKRRKYNENRNIKFFGITIGDENNVFWSNSAISGIRFGHIKALEVKDDDRVRLYLKSGKEVDLTNGSTDIGSGIREIVIEDEHEGEIEFDWEEIDRIELSSSPTNGTSSFGERLYGTVATRRGDTFTGFICWDMDEVFTNDVLDGEEGRRDREIKFSRIKTIERYSSKAANIILKSGDEMILRGTNDVDNSNRGIIVIDPTFGQVTVEWDEFEKVDFTDAPVNAVNYSEFDGGRPLSGTVFTQDGESYTGQIRWDDDEEYTWEILDGNNRKLEFDIEFGLIKEIKQKSYQGAIVTTWNGKTFQLRDSNDVNEENKGIFVLQSDGKEVEVAWDDFDRVEFAKK